jgi:transposase InsO family protein
VTYIDKATSYRAVVLIKHKSDAFEAFKTYKAYAENVLGSKIKELQMDQGGEFVSNGFRKFCADAGILIHFSTRNRPQQNGVAERANRMIDEHTTAMLYEAGLHASLKGEAVAAYIHVWKCLPTTANSDNSKTPHELWFC